VVAKSNKCRLIHRCSCGFWYSSLNLLFQVLFAFLYELSKARLDGLQETCHVNDEILKLYGARDRSMEQSEGPGECFIHTSYFIRLPGTAMLEQADTARCEWV